MCSHGSAPAERCAASRTWVGGVGTIGLSDGETDKGENEHQIGGVVVRKHTCSWRALLLLLLVGWLLKGLKGLKVLEKGGKERKSSKYRFC